MRPRAALPSLPLPAGRGELLAPAAAAEVRH